jgi:LPS-assembly protein
VRRLKPSNGFAADGRPAGRASRRARRLRGLLLGATALFCVWRAALGAAEASDSPVDLIADEAGYDQELGVYVARGHVEMAQDDRVVMADTITYNERSKTISAAGNVTLLLPSGDTVFANYVDLSDDFKNGVIKSFRALLKDKSRLAAYSAYRVDGTKQILNKAVYTPCLPCRTDPTRQPVWQIKADQVVRDQTAQTITYHGAWMEMWGLPVFYTPFFQHPDVDVKRQTGLLNPTFSVSSGRSGVQVRQPYFITLGDDKDVTLTPIARISGEPDPAGGVLLGEYRQRVPNGVFTLAASSTYEAEPDDSDEDDRQLRGHVAGQGLFDLGRDWRWGFNFKNTTDRDYLRQYHLGSRRWLEDTLWSEGFFGRSYFEARGYGWQSTDDDLRDDTAPIIAPLLNYSFTSEPGAGGGYWGLDVGMMNLVRREGRDSFRVSMHPSWTLPYTSSWGDVWELNLSVAADLYATNRTDPDSDNFDPSKETSTFDGVTGRVFPQGSLKWRYPFVKPGESFTQVLQPIVQLVMSPDCCNTGKIPNEDSRAFEWDDTKVFAADRFTGLDRVDSGSRVNYGFDWSAYNNSGGRAEVFLGQSYQFIRSHDEPDNSGIRDDLTDLVGRVALQPNELLNATYRFRFDVDDAKMKRQEVSLTAGPQEFYGSLNYIHLSDNDDFGSREQIYGALNTKFLEYWSASAGASYDMVDDKVNGLYGGFGYNDECFGFNLNAQYSPDGDTDLSSGKFAAFVTFTFKNLGDIGASF